MTRTRTCRTATATHLVPIFFPGLKSDAARAGGRPEANGTAIFRESRDRHSRDWRWSQKRNGMTVAGPTVVPPWFVPQQPSLIVAGKYGHGRAPRVPLQASPNLQLWAKISSAAQPARSSRARSGRNRKQAAASSSRPSRARSESSLSFNTCRCSTSEAA